MPRRAREKLNTSFFHVIVQGVNKEYIFEKEIYKKKFFNLLKENKEKYSIDIIAYVIMNNHSHLLLHVESIKDMSNFMKKINEEFARYYNYKENRVGYVFRDRFLSEPITSEKYLINCLVYIHNNPVKANIVNKAEQYKYSSYNDFVKKRMFVNEKIIELVFSKGEINAEEFAKLHLKKTYFFKEYDDMQKENLSEIMQEFKTRYKKDWQTIIKDNVYLEQVVVEIKERMKISNCELARIVKVHRHKVERILKRR